MHNSPDTSTQHEPQAHTNGAPSALHRRGGSGGGRSNGKNGIDEKGEVVAGEQKGSRHSSSSGHPTSWWTWAAYLLLIAVSKYTLPADLHPRNPTRQHVWYYGWVTALSTGLGAAPLLLTHDMGKQVIALEVWSEKGTMNSCSAAVACDDRTAPASAVVTTSTPRRRVGTGHHVSVVYSRQFAS